MLKKALLFIIASFGFAASLLADNTRFSPYSGTLDIVSSGSGTLSAGNTMYINNVSLTSGTTAFNVTSGTVFGAGLSGTTPVFQVGGGSFVVRANGDVVINDTGLSTAPQWPFLYIGGRIGAGINLDQYTFGVLDGRLSILQNGGFSTIDTNGPLGIDSGSSYLHLYAYDHVGLGSFADDVMIQSGNMGIGTTAPTARLHVAGTALVTSTATFQPTTDGTGTVKIVNSDGSNTMFQTDFVSTNTNNLISIGDSDFEAGTGNWAAIGAGTLSSDASTVYSRSKSLKYITAAAADDGVKLNITLADSTIYVLEMFINATAASSNYQLFYSSDGSVASTSIVVSSITTVANKWIKIVGTFTTPASHSGTPFIGLKKSDGVARTFFIDGGFLRSGSITTNGAPPIYVGKLQMAGNSILTEPLTLFPRNDSSHFFAIYANNSRELLSVDTASRRVKIGFDGNIVPTGLFDVNGVMQFYPGGATVGNVSGIDLFDGATPPVRKARIIGELNTASGASGDVAVNVTVGGYGVKTAGASNSDTYTATGGNLGVSKNYWSNVSLVLPTAQLHVHGATDEVQLLLEANVTQNTDVFQEKDGSGNLKVNISSNGYVGVSTGIPTQPVDVAGNVLTQGFEIKLTSSVTTTDNGIGGVRSAYTVNANRSHYEITCSDADGTDLTLGETGIIDGMELSIISMGSKSCNITDSAGVQEVAGAITLGTYDSISFRYAQDRWVETGASDN